MKYLSKYGFKINIYGDGWKNIKGNKNLILNNTALYNSDYRNAIRSSKITLCFLRKINDDLQTSRSIEIV